MPHAPPSRTICFDFRTFSCGPWSDWGDADAAGVGLLIDFTLLVIFQRGRMSRRWSRTIYVGNLPGDIREREVEDLFYKVRFFNNNLIRYLDLLILPKRGICDIVVG